MATNLLIAFPDLTYHSLITYGTNPELGATNYDLIAGARYTTYKRSAAGTSTIFDFDLGASATQAANCLILVRAKMLSTQDSTATVTVQSANAYFAALDTTGAITISSNLYGPDVDDFSAGANMLTTFSTARRYWRVTLTTVASFKHEFSKLYLGTYFDMGVDPSYPMDIKSVVTSTKDRRPRFIVNYNWRGVTTAKVQELRSKILMKKDIFPIFLDDVNGTYHKYTLGHKLLNCWVRDTTITQTGYDRHDIDMNLEELA